VLQFLDCIMHYSVEKTFSELFNMTSSKNR